MHLPEFKFEVRKLKIDQIHKIGAIIIIWYISHTKKAKENYKTLEKKT